MTKLKQLLSEIGCGPTEIELYCKGVAVEKITAADLARRIRGHRTTVYSALAALGQKGLVTKQVINRVTYFIFQQPDWLRGYFDRQIQEVNKKKEILTEAIREFSTIAPSPHRQISTEYYEGPEAIKQAVEHALYAHTRTWQIIAPVDNFFSKMDTMYTHYFVSERKSNRIKAQTLWEAKKSKSITLEEIAYRSPRILPKSFQGKFRSTMILFDDKILLISSTEPYTAVLVSSAEFRELLGVMFDGLWQISEPYLK